MTYYYADYLDRNGGYIHGTIFILYGKTETIRRAKKEANSLSNCTKLMVHLGDNDNRWFNKHGTRWYRV